MPTFDLPDGTSLYYTERGEGRPLVLLNGMSQSTANWLSQSKHLAAHHRVVMYDARGQGRSALGATPISLDDHVDDLHALLGHLAFDERPILCGFSHGSRIALRYAARYPLEIERLVLTSIGTNADALRQTITRGWAEVLRLGGLEAMAWMAIPTILGEDFLAANQKHLDAMVRATLQRNTRDGLQALLDGLRQYAPPLDDVGAVVCPTLLITSDGDLLVSTDSAAALAEALGATHATVTGCGHTIPIEAPDTWRDHVLAFLGASDG